MNDQRIIVYSVGTFLAAGLLITLLLTWGVEKSSTAEPVEENLGFVPCKDDPAKSIGARIKDCPIPANERAAFKGKELAKVGAVARTVRVNYDIEIVSTEAHAKGVTVFSL